MHLEEVACKLSLRNMNVLFIRREGACGGVGLPTHWILYRGWQCQGEPGALETGCFQMECSTNLKSAANWYSEYRIARENVGHSIKFGFQRINKEIVSISTSQ